MVWKLISDYLKSSVMRNKFCKSIDLVVCHFTKIILHPICFYVSNIRFQMKAFIRTPQLAALIFYSWVWAGYFYLSYLTFINSHYPDFNNVILTVIGPLGIKQDDFEQKPLVILFSSQKESVSIINRNCRRSIQNCRQS